MNIKMLNDNKCNKFAKIHKAFIFIALFKYKYKFNQNNS